MFAANRGTNTYVYFTCIITILLTSRSSDWSVITPFFRILDGAVVLTLQTVTYSKVIMLTESVQNATKILPKYL